MSKRLRKAGVWVLSAIMALTMCSATTAFAASGAANSDNTDYVKNNTGNATATRQANSATTTWTKNAAGDPVVIGEDAGVVTLGKILNTNQANKFPNIEDFVYKVTPVSTWDNANVDTAKSGATIAKGDMPKPSSGDGNAHHNAVNKGTGNDWYTLVTLGNFKDSTEANTSSVANSDAASNTDGISDNYRRTRTTDLKFNFTKAGYYMYKVEEVGSIKNGTAITAENVQLKKDVVGVDYDNNTYYMVFYVANKQATANSTEPAPDEYGHGTKTGDTIGAEAGDIITGGAQAPAGGVYVHSITSWTNSQSTDNKAADLQDGDALDNAKDLMNQMDNGGNAAKSNTGRVDGNTNGVTNNDNPAASNGASPANGGKPSTVTHDNLGKVGLSSTDAPNYLEAYRMWNALISHDIVLKKNVTGNLGDRTKQFEFTVTLTGLEAEQTYTTNITAGSTDGTTSTNNVTNTGDQTTANVELYDATKGTISQDKKAFTSAADGTATFKVKLRDDECLVINALPRSASYQISEAASDHVPQYEVVSTNKAEGDAAAVITKAADKTITASNTALATGIEFVDRTDGTVVVLYENNRDLATITGIPALDYMVYALIALILGLAAYGIIRRRRAYADVDMM